mmetsp:Transcript_48001/g.91748  ORF Transcript_48001/g.91748 Transcript_48001/m.91748 type:complete len:281 (+) Transcript_48001:151-993(+)
MHERTIARTPRCHNVMKSSTFQQNKIHVLRVFSRLALSYDPITWSATAHVIACPGGMRINRGSKPLNSAKPPSRRATVTIQLQNPVYGVPEPFSWAIMRVFATSNGPVATGPAVAAKNPLIMDCHGARVWPSPSDLFHIHLSKLLFITKRHIWFVPLRSTVGVAPAQSPKGPCSFKIVDTQWRVPLYFIWVNDTPFCCCSFIFTTSKGVTTNRASVTPAPKPASILPWLLRLPSLSRKAVPYNEFVPMRNAYLRVRWVAKGVSPFQRARMPSSRYIEVPQ